MAAYFGGFESVSSIEEKRELKRKTRAEIIQKAKRQYEKEEQREEERKARGEDTWMLPDIEQRLQQINKEHSVKKKKKKEKSKKKKKDKKKKGRKEKSKAQDDSSSGTSEDCDEWVEAPSTTEDVDEAGKAVEPSDSTAVSSNASQRDEWMTFDFLTMKTTSVGERRAQKDAEKEAEREKALMLEQAGLHKLELNPYWKDGGTGLPPESTASVAATKAGVVDDGGRSWLMKSYQRMQEQAERERRSLDDVVAERYGSMELFQKRLQEAEDAAFPRRREERGTDKGGERRERWRREPGPARDGEREKDWQRERGERDRERDRERDWARDRERDRERGKWDRKRGERDRERGERDRERGERDPEKDPERDRDPERQTDVGRTRGTEHDNDRQKERDGGNGRDRERDKDHGRERDRERVRFLKPSDSDEPPALGPGFRRPAATTPTQFLKPREDDGGDKCAWRKKTDGERVRDEPGTNRNLKDGEGPAAPTGTSSSESSDEEEEEEQEEEVRLLTDEEMNKLGAKLVKAELMGNKALMDSLKAELDAARRARETGARDPRPTRAAAAPDEAVQEVVLFRTDPSGRAWPVGDPAQRLEPRGGGRRKPIETHVAGERVRYFADDDRMDLKEMVRREKMSTAQDQNALYSRMAAKMMGRQDGDNYTLDDMFVSSAAQKERAGLEDERDRQRAMKEGRSLAATLEKCRFCFSSSELPKHLVVAIGAKSYLCLPNCVSLTEGHCLIAPLQHHCCATGLDEDVWNEMQMFRRSLVRMFESRGLDCVFMETHMNPRKRMHLLYECVPLPRELGDMAPIYFKKAIMECDEEWAMNKKLVDLSSKNIRQAVPRGLPYFSVDFGLQGGFAHVIESRDKFPHFFGKEVLGGMLDLEPRRWRKPIRENFDDQRKKVLQFSQWWKPHDWTKTDQ